MNGLGQAVEDYLTIRRALGHKLADAARLLPHFAAWMATSGHEHVTVCRALEWATLPKIGSASTVHARRIVAVRGFAKHLHGIDPAHEIPPTGLIPCPKHRAVPYLYSDADIAALMTAAAALPTPLRAATYETLIGLLAVTGLRIGEAIRLDRDSIDWSAGRLVVCKSKFGKSREVVVHPSTLDAIATYSEIRDRTCGHTTALFVSRAGNRLVYTNVCEVFGRLRDTAGLKPRSPQCRPRIHDLRHSFAVRTLIDWYSRGLDVGERLAWLSTYLGHAGPTSTYWYLSASPELMALAADRVEAAMAVTP